MDANNKSYFKVLKCLVILFWSALFLLKMLEIWRQFLNNDTFITIDHEAFESMDLPVLTICPNRAFKTLPPNGTDSTQIKDHGFTVEDIFHNADELLSNSAYELRETMARFFVKCHTIRVTSRARFQDYSNKYSFKKDTDYTIYIHDPGEEFWLLLGIYPYEITSVKVQANNSHGMAAADLLIKKEIIRSDDCINDIGSDQFAKCATEELIKQFLAVANCTSFLLEHLHPQQKLPYCHQQYLVYNDAVNLAQNLLKDILISRKCASMCDRTRYSVNLAEYHENVMFGSDDYFLACFFGTLNVEHKTEKYVYGFGTAIVAVGGSMGLFLGFSCLSISLSLLKMLENKFK